MKNIYLIVAESGAGKTTIANRLVAEGFKSIESYTTRKPRYENETGHIFVDDKEFDKLTDIVAYTEFGGFRYCATTQQVQENDLYIIDPKGVEYFKAHYKGNKGVKVIYIHSKKSVRFERMIKRLKHTDINRFNAIEQALDRIINDATEFAEYASGKAKIDYIAVNDWNCDLSTITANIKSFITGEEE